MRIAIDAAELEGKPTGVGRYLGNMLNCWAEISSSDEIYLLHQKTIPEQFQTHPGIKLVKIPENIFSKGVFRQQVFLARTLRKIKPDVFFAPAYSMPLNWNGPTVLTVHDISFQTYPQWFSKLHGMRMRYLTRKSIKKATEVITDSNFVREDIIKTYGIAEERINTIYLGFDDELKKLPFTPEKELRERLWQDSPFALMVGTLFERRYPMEVIKAFLNKDLEDRDLIIVGADRRLEKTDLNEEIKKLNLAEKVLWLDYTSSEDLMGLYRSADCLIYLSEYEGFGLPPLEGMAFGLPVLVSGKGTLKEIYGEAAMSVRDENEMNIAAALVKLFDDKEVRKNLTAKGYKLVEELSYMKCARKTLEILRKVGGEYFG